MVVEDILTYGNKLGGLMHFILSKAKCFPRISAKQRMALFLKTWQCQFLAATALT